MEIGFVGDIEPRWRAQRCTTPLPPGVAHVWGAPLDVAPERLRELTAVLSQDERTRAARFRTSVLTQRFIAARGQLRELLGGYLGTAPGEVTFEYDAHGKPAFHMAPGGKMPCFNVSHSGALALYAVTLDAVVGVDVEEMRTFADMPAVAAHAFSPVERQRLAAVPPTQYALAFYSCWTRKEAYLKAVGTGLLTPLDGFDVSFAPGEQPALLRIAGDADAPRQWTLRHLDPAPDYVGAVAVVKSTV